MEASSGNIIIEYIDIGFPKKEQPDEFIENRKDNDCSYSINDCWSNREIYEICNNLNSFESYWTEMSYYLYETK